MAKIHFNENAPEPARRIQLQIPIRNKAAAACYRLVKSPPTDQAASRWERVILRCHIDLINFHLVSHEQISHDRFSVTPADSGMRRIHQWRSLFRKCVDRFAPRCDTADEESVQHP